MFDSATVKAQFDGTGLSNIDAVALSGAWGALLLEGCCWGAAAVGRNGAAPCRSHPAHTPPPASPVPCCRHDRNVPGPRLLFLQLQRQRQLGAGQP